MGQHFAPLSLSPHLMLIDQLNKVDAMWNIPVSPDGLQLLLVQYQRPSVLALVKHLQQTSNTHQIMSIICDTLSGWQELITLTTTRPPLSCKHSKDLRNLPPPAVHIASISAAHTMS
jgi:hypothetical protein